MVCCAGSVLRRFLHRELWLLVRAADRVEDYPDEERAPEDPGAAPVHSMGGYEDACGFVQGVRSIARTLRQVSGAPKHAFMSNARGTPPRRTHAHTHVRVRRWSRCGLRA
jgi:hypothetical protein